MADINLLPSEEKAADSFTRLSKRLTVISIIILALTAVLTLAVLIVFTTLASSKADLDDRFGSAAQEINNLKAKEELVTVIKDKAEAGDKILGARFDYPKVFEDFSKLVPIGVYLTDVKEANGKITISGKAQNSNVMAGFVASLVSKDGAKLLTGVSIDSLGSEDEGVYTFVMSMTLVGAKPPEVKTPEQPAQVEEVEK